VTEDMSERLQGIFHVRGFTVNALITPNVLGVKRHPRDLRNVLAR
jgi:hypothetical protein